LGARDEAAFVAGDFLAGAAVEGFVDEAAADSFAIVGGLFALVEFVDDLEVPFVGVLLAFALHFLLSVSMLSGSGKGCFPYRYG
jgi:hypothetical protein